MLAHTHLCKSPEDAKLGKSTYKAQQSPTDVVCPRTRFTFPILLLGLVFAVSGLLSRGFLFVCFKQYLLPTAFQVL